MQLYKKVPGKLYIIGEYNVLKSGHSALIAPVDLYLHGSFLLNDETIIIENDVTYTWEQLQVNTPHQLINTVETIHYFNEYLAYRNIERRHFTYMIKNNLISDDQIKYGLGSSAASIVLTLKLLDDLYKTHLSPLILFKMGVIIQSRLKNISSGGDLAVTVFNSPIFYTRYDDNWFMKVDKTFQLLTVSWPLLDIEPLTNLPDFAIGWTKETSPPNKNGVIEKSFFKKAERLVKKYKKTFSGKYLVKYQKLLDKLANTHQGLMTNKLRRLIESAHQLNIPAKISGAGYGDCGIAQINDKTQFAALKEVWQNEGIKVLEIWRKDEQKT